MHTYGRLFADRAHQRTTPIRCRSLTTIVLALSLGAAACGADPATDSAFGSPSTSTVIGDTGSGVADDPAADGILTETDDAPRIGPAATAPVDEPVPGDDDFVVGAPPTDTEVLDAPDPEPLEPGSAESAIVAAEAALESAGAGTNGGAILDRVAPIDDAPAGDVISIRDGRRINEVGEAVRLDDTALLACGSVEIALTALDEGRTAKAVELLRSAATNSETSSVSAVGEWASILEQAADQASGGSSTTAVSPLLAFLTTCTQGGYEL